jgi:hypothetical protein
MKLQHILWWLAFAASCLIVLAALPGYLLLILPAGPGGLSGAELTAIWLGKLFSLASAVLCLALAALLFFKKPDERMALSVSFYVLFFGVVMVGPLEYVAPYWFPSARDLALQLQSLTFVVPTLYILLIFPTGYYAPRWSRWLMAVAFLSALAPLFIVRDYQELVRFNSAPVQVSFAIYGVLFLAGIGIQIFRYRRLYTPMERQQSKWVIFGLFISYLLLGSLTIPYYYLQNLPPGTPRPAWAAFSSLGWWVGLSIQPLALTVAILRARLWDIDVIVRRTLLYALVTLLLAVIYFGSVIFLQRVFSQFAGAQQNELITVLSTLAIAALFIPLRDRVQAVIDRRFNRKKYDAKLVLSRFAETVRDETDLDALTGELARVVQETMQPKSMSMWLKREQSGK